MTIGIRPQADVVLPVKFISIGHCTIRAWRSCVWLLDM